MRNCPSQKVESQMKSATLAEFRSHVDQYLAQIDVEDVLLTLEGKPIAVVKSLAPKRGESAEASIGRQRELDETRLWLAASDRVLKELWDNEEDAVYDQL